MGRRNQTGRLRGLREGSIGEGLSERGGDSERGGALKEERARRGKSSKSSETGRGAEMVSIGRGQAQRGRNAERGGA